MTHKEIATKILAVVDLYRKSYVKTGKIWYDRAGKSYEDGKYLKTIDECFTEFFGDSFVYKPYRDMVYVSPEKAEKWANSVLKMD